MICLRENVEMVLPKKGSGDAGAPRECESSLGFGRRFGNMETLLIRADASLAIGTGHVMRCLALAQAWQDAGGRAVIAMSSATSAVQDRMARENVDIELFEAHDLGTDLSHLTALANRYEASWAAVDGYRFNEAYQRGLKTAGLRVLWVDDLGRPMYYAADLVLNQNLHARETFYRQRSENTRLLRGPRYAMLRREFSSYRGQRDFTEPGRRILVTMGGSDPENATLKVIEAIGTRLEDDDLEVRVAVGGINPFVEVLEKAVLTAGSRIQLWRDVANMPELMMWSDIAVANAGTVSWELCHMAVPTLSIELADNQRPVGEGLERCGAAIFLGNHRAVSTEEIAGRIRVLLNDKQMRMNLSQNARKLVDGRGAERVVRAIKSGDVQLRRADEGDKETLWKWANDAEVRSSSFSDAQIPWEQHNIWFERKMKDQRAKLFIAINGKGEPVGQIRLDEVRPGEAEIDLSVAKERRGRGYAALLIERASQLAFSSIGLNRLHAFVKPQNSASMRAFEQADFTQTNGTAVKGQTAIHYVRDRES